MTSCRKNESIAGKIVLRLGLAELFLAEEGEVPNTDDDLEDQANPEASVAEAGARVLDDRRVVRQRARRAEAVGTVDDGTDTTNDLRGHQRKGDVETSKGLQEKHTDSDTY